MRVIQGGTIRWVSGSANSPPGGMDAEQKADPACPPPVGPILGLRHAERRLADLEPWDRDFPDDLAELCADLRRLTGELRHDHPAASETVERIERELADHGWTRYEDIRDATNAASDDLANLLAAVLSEGAAATSCVS